jgi:hypothetical protein
MAISTLLVTKMLYRANGKMQFAMKYVENDHEVMG